jgi:hypothetical protein
LEISVLAVGRATMFDGMTIEEEEEGT